MYLQINTLSVVVDISPTPKYVKKNEQSELIVLTTDYKEAIGAVSSDGELIRYFVKSRVNSDWDTLLDIIFIEDSLIPEDYENNKYIYDENGFHLYEGIVPSSNETLTEESEIASEGLLDIAEIVNNHEIQISDLMSMYEALDARVSALEELLPKEETTSEK